MVKKETKKEEKVVAPAEKKAEAPKAEEVVNNVEDYPTLPKGKTLESDHLGCVGYTDDAGKFVRL